MGKKTYWMRDVWKYVVYKSNWVYWVWIITNIWWYKYINDDWYIYIKSSNIITNWGIIPLFNTIELDLKIKEEDILLSFIEKEIKRTELIIEQ